MRSILFGLKSTGIGSTKFRSCSVERSNRSSSIAMAAQTKKIVHLLRHGQTEMNVHLEQYEKDPEFKDPMMFDTVLTSKGIEEAKAARDQTNALQPSPEVLMSSPLSRALHTAELAFEGFSGPKLAIGLARERTYFASDVGKPKSELVAKWRDWSFEDVSEEIWWLDHIDDRSDSKKIVPETEENLKNRINKLKTYLRSRPEACFALVVHRDIIENLVGISPGNCEFATLEL